VVEAKADGDATEQDLAIKEVNTGVFAFDTSSTTRRSPSASTTASTSARSGTLRSGASRSSTCSPAPRSSTRAPPTST
jgi:hypothetical protein